MLLEFLVKKDTFRTSIVVTDHPHILGIIIQNDAATIAFVVGRNFFDGFTCFQVHFQEGLCIASNGRQHVARLKVVVAKFHEVAFFSVRKSDEVSPFAIFGITNSNSIGRIDLIADNRLANLKRFVFRSPSNHITRVFRVQHQRSRLVITLVHVEFGRISLIGAHLDFIRVSLVRHDARNFDILTRRQIASFFIGRLDVDGPKMKVFISFKILHVQNGLGILRPGQGANTS